jgi:hypothetical protein
MVSILNIEKIKDKQLFSLNNPASVLFTCILVFSIALLIELIHFLLVSFIDNYGIYLGSWAIIVASLFCLDIIDLSDKLNEIGLESLISSKDGLLIENILITSPKKLYFDKNTQFLELFLSGFILFLKIILAFVSVLVIINQFLLIFF